METGERDWSQVSHLGSSRRSPLLPHPGVGVVSTGGITILLSETKPDSCRTQLYVFLPFYDITQCEEIVG